MQNKLVLLLLLSKVISAADPEEKPVKTAVSAPKAIAGAESPAMPPSIRKALTPAIVGAMEAP